MTHAGTNTYLYGRVGAVVIDPGPADEGHIGRIRDEAAARGGIAAVLLTHSHADHSDGVGVLGIEPTRLAAGDSAYGLTAVATPGHAADHLCYLTADRVCFAGDLVLGEGSSFVPPDGGSLSAYMASLERLQGLEIDLICPGHGPWVTDPRAKLAEYVEHRMMRERRLVAALERGERSRRALLAEVWDDVPEQLVPAAAVTMETHLGKLADEGRLPGDLED